MEPEAPGSATALPAVASVHQRFSLLGGRIGEALFRPLSFPTEDVERLRRLARDGTLVYVGQHPSHLLYLYLLHALSWAGLPQPAWVSGILHWLWQPLELLDLQLGLLRRALTLRRSLRWEDRDPSLDAALCYDLARQGHATLVFLAPSARVLGEERVPAVAALLPLVKAQRESARPLYLVPQLLLTSLQPPSRRPSLQDRLLGSVSRPGLLRELWQFVWTGSATLVRVGRELDLQALLAAHPVADDVELALLANERLVEACHNEERVAVGPLQSDPRWAQEAALAHPEVRALMLPAGEEQAAPPSARRRAERTVARYVREIAARYRIRYIRFLDLVVGWLLRRMYDATVVDEEGLRRVAAAMRETPLLVCTSHKSHIDYLIVSSTFHHHGLTPPHIAAGVNLSFWPLGPIFRGCGAFFLRRSFKGNALYAAVFKAYLGHLLHEGFSIEFFIEGGRSRTGKLLQPKLGMLGMILEAWRSGAVPDLHVLPVAVDYERIIEMGSYTHEARGGQKRPENIRGLVEARKLLSTRFGRIYVNFGEPIRLTQFVAQHLPREAPRLDDGRPARDEDLRPLTRRLAYKTLYEVGKAAAVTPTALTALALLVHRGRALSRQEFHELTGFFYELLYTLKARFSPMLLAERRPSIDGVLNHLVQEGLALQESTERLEGEPLLRVPEEARLTLDYYKNNVIHHLAAPAIACIAIAQGGGQPIEYRRVHDDALFVSRLLKLEFLYEAAAGFEDNLVLTLSTLAAHGYIDVDEQVRIVPRRLREIGWVAAVLDNYLEAYWSAATATGELRRFPLWQRELVLRALEQTRRNFLLGQILSPEAMNKALIDNAVAWLVERGLLVADTRSGSGPKQTLALPGDDGPMRALTTTLARLLPAARDAALRPGP